MNILDRTISWFAPQIGLRRAQARQVLQRSYQGAESNRLTNNKRPRNLAADQELMGPYGADQMRAWARAMVRDNAYAWNIVDTIVSNVIGDGITAQSTYETVEGDDIEDVNELRDKTWSEWCEVTDINGQLTFCEIQILAQREIVEAGEVLIRKIKTPGKEYKGISRPVPLALELIEADRLALERDTYKSGSAQNGNRVVRGVELDDKGKPVAYWIYPQHPSSPYSFGQSTPERIPADQIIHLFRKDRVGQTRGISWFAPVMQPMRDLGNYIENELQSSAVASCFGVVVKTETPVGGLSHPEGEDSTDDNGNRLSYVEPGMVNYLRPGEDISVVNPARPNSSAEPWINLILRSMAAGTGVSFESLSKNFAMTSYSSSRTSKLDDRPRNKRHQNYMVMHLCQPVWDAFCDAAAVQGLDGFPTSTELLEDRRRYVPVEWQLPELEWVDPMSEQQSAESALNSFTDTYQNVLGARGMSYRGVFWQRYKEEKLRKKLGLFTPEELQLSVQSQAMQPQEGAATALDENGQSINNLQAAALNGAQVTSLVDVLNQVGTGALPKDSAKAIIKAAFPLIPEETIQAIIDPIEPGSVSVDGAPVAVSPDSQGQATSGVYMGLSTQQWNRNRKAIQKTLDELTQGTMSEAAARVFLASVGMPEEHVDVLVKDAMDGSLETQLPAEAVNGE